MNARRISILTALALTEAAVLAPFLSLLTPPPIRGAPGGALGLMWLILFGLAIQWKILAHFDVSLRTQRIMMGGWLVALVIAAELQSFAPTPTLAPDVLTLFPGFIAALVLWWRGMALGVSTLHPRDAEMRLQVGLLLLIAISAATLFSQDWDVLINIVAFFFGALIAVSLSNLELTERSERGRRVVMDKIWWGWPLAAVLGVLLVGLLLTSVMTGRSVVGLIGLLLSIVLLPILLLVSLIPQSFFDWLRELIQRIASAFSSLAPPERGALPPQPPTTGPVLPTVPPAVSFGFGLVVFAILVVVVLLLMRRAERQMSAAHTPASDSEGRLGEPGVDQVEAENNRPPGLSQLRRWLAAMTIRRLYARAVHEAARRGYRRLPAQTPNDFLPALQSAFPNAEIESSTITQAYVAAHYGEVPDSRETLDALKAAWERMRATKIVPTSDARLSTR